MSVCRVCGREVNNLRKHASGKWHNDSSDFEHLYLALQLTPNGLAHLKTMGEAETD